MQQSESGRLEQAEGRWQLRFTRHLPHPPEKVWRALTEPEHLAVWFPTTIEGDREAGASLRFTFQNDEAPPQTGEMITYDPPSTLEFRWGDDDTLRFELRPEDGGAGTALVLVNTFDEIGKAARDAAGWHGRLDMLDAHLRGESPADPMDLWQQVHPGYVERFGPEAATIGPPRD
jgi:uncharacterized protein YndB with AHSA1/START domain